MKNTLLPLSLLLATLLGAQPAFEYGADLSYVNEMEDCGVVFRENGAPKDPYRIFADHGLTMARIRLWHTPAWYDTLNAGRRYSDFNDVRRSIRRAKQAGMRVLLDFHLSDIWADPNRQLVPAAWRGVVNNLPALQDSLHRYVFGTLLALHREGLLPEMVQLGNETNRGILLPPEQAEGAHHLDWPRQAALFRTGLQAVRDAAAVTGRPIRLAIHLAMNTGEKDNVRTLMAGFDRHGIDDYDVIGLSYYWAWHKPATIADAGALIEELRRAHPGKDAMIFETGYPYSMEWADASPNLYGDLHSDYAPPTPAIQKKWLVDLTREVKRRGGTGVMYWEPAWVSSPCRTPWGQGSGQENSTFFDFKYNVIPEGGIGWMKTEIGN
jgi:arabinogalactan endo-1,4-beta-galactosidase